MDEWSGFAHPKRKKKKKRVKRKNSLIHQKDGTCYMCLKLYGKSKIFPIVHKHHAFLGPRRETADREGLFVFLCPEHHEFSKDAVHEKHENLRIIQRDCQKAWEQEHTRTEWMELMGRNYRTK